MTATVFTVWRVHMALVAYTAGAFGWPDGAPCTYAVIESMNPLEAVEHQGGLQMTPPPFHIATEQPCYWRGQPVELSLRGNSSRDQFKGFAIQPFIYSGTRRGQRLGQFLRLDDNGSWQQQCFRRADSVTHTHDEPKARMRLWWRSDAAEEEDVVQFVATVVVSLRKFWVKSVVSAPLAPCRHADAATDWTGPTASVSVPPPVSSFKLDTFRMFNKEKSAGLALSLSSLPDRSKHTHSVVQPRPTVELLQQLPPTVVQLVTVAPPLEIVTNRRLSHVIPITDMESNRRPSHLQQQQKTFATMVPFVNIETKTSFRQQQQNTFQQQQNGFRPFQQQKLQQQLLRQSQQLPQSRITTIGQQGNECRDFDTPQQCAGWLAFCPQNAYMRAFCRRTCRFC